MATAATARRAFAAPVKVGTLVLVGDGVKVGGVMVPFGFGSVLLSISFYFPIKQYLGNTYIGSVPGFCPQTLIVLFKLL